ncbi:hypothetical protein HO173_010269 [Letharia columbiana]|uniref:Uncharacterized protein n=1 Tax=Letharia columbiana TaxID=112416 RepID=A0A8H6FN02_9LECA|nr:uncharacterized protein HO173_010269 [Letharia columbiana]KAF6231517.1 hypothetical protein HO173_010269 [Letharia columbiana]
MNGLEIFFSLVEGPTHWLCKSTVPEDGTARRPLDSSSQHTRARNYEQVSASSPLAPPSKILVWHQMLRMLLRPQDEALSRPLGARFVFQRTCIVTLSICVYTAVHLNIPQAGTSNSAIHSKRFGWV